MKKTWESNSIILPLLGSRVSPSVHLRHNCDTFALLRFYLDLGGLTILPMNWSPSYNILLLKWKNPFFTVHKPLHTKIFRFLWITHPPLLIIRGHCISYYSISHTPYCPLYNNLEVKESVFQGYHIRKKLTCPYPACRPLSLRDTRPIRLYLRLY